MHLPIAHLAGVGFVKIFFVICIHVYSVLIFFNTHKFDENKCVKLSRLYIFRYLFSNVGYVCLLFIQLKHLFTSRCSFILMRDNKVKADYILFFTVIQGFLNSL